MCASVYLCVYNNNKDKKTKRSHEFEMEYGEYGRSWTSRERVGVKINTVLLYEILENKINVKNK